MPSTILGRVAGLARRCYERFRSIVDGHRMELNGSQGVELVGKMLSRHGHLRGVEIFGSKCN
jgi:hypothetical protein